MKALTGIIRQLNANRELFRQILVSAPDGIRKWKPSPDQWCLLEIVCHLADEEREDFRARLKHTLETPELPLPKIDPPGWVSERRYIRQDYRKKVNEFLKEREKSVKWLRSLRAPKWKNVHVHPKFGKLSAEMFLANWLAHDYLHIRQITRRKYEYLKNKINVRFDYAGEW